MGNVFFMLIAAFAVLTGRGVAAAADKTTDCNTALVELAEDIAKRQTFGPEQSLLLAAVATDPKLKSTELKTNLAELSGWVSGLAVDRFDGQFNWNQKEPEPLVLPDMPVEPVASVKPQGKGIVSWTVSKIKSLNAQIHYQARLKEYEKDLQYYEHILKTRKENFNNRQSDYLRDLDKYNSSKAKRIAELEDLLSLKNLPHPETFAHARDLEYHLATVATLTGKPARQSIPKPTEAKLKKLIERLSLRASLNPSELENWQSVLHTLLVATGTSFPEKVGLHPKTWQRPIWLADAIRLIPRPDGKELDNSINREALHGPPKGDYKISKEVAIDPDIQKFLEYVMEPEGETEWMHSPAYLAMDAVPTKLKETVVTHTIAAANEADATSEELTAAYYMASWGFFSNILPNDEIVNKINSTLQINHFDKTDEKIDAPIRFDSLTIPQFLELAESPKVQELSHTIQEPLLSFVNAEGINGQAAAVAKPKPKKKVKGEGKEGAPKATVRKYSETEIAELRKKAAKLIDGYEAFTIPVDAKTVAAARAFSNLESELNQRFPERDDLIAVLVRAMIGKNHVLMIGPGGTGKTSISKALMRSLVENGEPSFFWHQMTGDTEIRDLVGPLDPSKLPLGKYERLTDKGLLERRLVYLDEFFNPSPQIVQKVLGLMEDGEAYIDGKTVHGKPEFYVAGTNKYTSQLYTQTQNDDLTPNRDRFTYHQYVGPEIEQLSSVMAIQKTNGGSFNASRPLTFEEVEMLRVLRQQLAEKTHPEVTAATALLYKGMERRTAEEALAAVRKVEEETPRLAPWGPRYYPTRLYGPRTLVAMPKALQSGVVYEWMKNPTETINPISIEDLGNLEQFFSTSGRSNDLVEKERDSALNPYQMAQLDTILIERQAFREEYEALMQGLKKSPVLGKVHSITSKAGNYANQQELVEHLGFLVGLVEQETPILTQSRNSEVTPETVANLSAARKAKELIPVLIRKLEGN